MELQPADVFVRQKQRQDAGVVVRTDAEDEVGPRAGWVVVESGVGGAPVAELADDAVVASSSRGLAIARRIPSLTRLQPIVYSCRRPLQTRT